MSPWTRMWERNYFGELLPWLGTLMENSYTRGAVTGVGLVTAWVGLRDLMAVIFARWGQSDSPSPSSTPPDA